MTDPRSELDQIRQRAESAHGEVVRLCEGGRWTMRVPAEPTRDSDLMLAASLDDNARQNAALVAVLDLADEPTTDEFGNESVYVDLLRAAITDHLRSDQ